MLKSVEWSLEQPKGQIWDWSAGLELLGPELCRPVRGLWNQGLCSWPALPLQNGRHLPLWEKSPLALGAGVGLPGTPSQCWWSFGGLAFLRARQRAQPDP